MSADASCLPTLQRRRMSLLGKAAIDAAYYASDNDASESPLIFASRHGDMERSIGLLTQLTEKEGMSPTQFGLSVHNAIGAFLSIARQHRGNYTAIAAGSETTAAAFCEAQALLASGARKVHIVCYDAPLPPPYTGFTEQEIPLHAWACSIEASSKAGFSLHATAPSPEPNCQPDSLPVLNFLCGDQPHYTHRGSRCNWHWQRHA